MQVELSRLSLPTLKKLHALAVLRSAQGGSAHQVSLGRSGLARELASAAEASYGLNLDTQEEEDGWFLLNRSHQPTPLHSPPRSPSHRASSLPLLATTSDLSSEWSPPSWVTKSRSNVSKSASFSSNVVDRLADWNPPSWAPQLSLSAQKRSEVAQDSQRESAIEMGDRKTDWGWETPVWANTVDAKRDDETKDPHFPPSFGISDVLPHPPPHHESTSGPAELIKEWSAPSWAPPSAQIEPPPPQVPSAAKTVVPEVSEWTAPTWLRKVSIEGREREWDFSAAGLAV
ncbi:hypothetical protein BDY24DRAFT_389192 [Mrakia frigida]|uniref:uncharacterized protein n=1 Tax=Mrakia frigida TaxID=29902 RepID=UPI003FCC12F4